MKITTNRKIKILFFGDFGTSAPHNYVLDKKIQNVINVSDIVGLNFEGCVNKGDIISPTSKPIPQSEMSAQWCESNGFNLLSLANNHIMDFGEEGFRATLTSIPDNMVTVGAGDWEHAYSPAVFEINNKRIAFIAGSSADFSSLKLRFDDKSKIGCAWINSPYFTKAIIKAVKEYDHVFIISHAGVEHLDFPIPEWRELYQFWIDLGVDGVIASHPHVPQGVECYKDRPIFYSLGNFIFQGTKDPQKLPAFWNNSLIADIEIISDGISFNYIPIILDKGCVKLDQSERTKEHVRLLNEIVTDKNRYCEELNKYLPIFYEKFIDWLQTSMNLVQASASLKSIKTFLKLLLRGKVNKKVFMHQLREESTRSILIRLLKNQTKSYL